VEDLTPLGVDPQVDPGQSGHLARPRPGHHHGVGPLPVTSDPGSHHPAVADNQASRAGHHPGPQSPGGPQQRGPHDLTVDAGRGGDVHGGEVGSQIREGGRRRRLIEQGDGARPDRPKGGQLGVDDVEVSGRGHHELADHVPQSRSPRR
jgi:hypothetical protein